MTESGLPSSRMLQDILDQPRSLLGVVDYQLNEGRSALFSAAAALVSARSVAFTGMGSSYFASLPLVHTLKRFGIPASLVEASALLHYMEDFPEASDVVVLISRSGASVEIVRLLPALRARGARLIGLTNDPGSFLASACDFVVHINSLSDEMVAVQTYTATLLAQALLGAAALGQDLDTAAAEAKVGIQGLEDALADYREKSRSWKWILEGAPAVYLLARSISMASALEGALLFNEVAKIPSVAMDAGQFRHGPAEVVDGRFSGLVFCPPDATQPLNLHLGAELARIGGRIAVIGPDEHTSTVGNLQVWPLPRVMEWLQPVAEIIPVQFAALRLAQWQGISPGKFRLVPQVTSSEETFAK